VRIETLLELIKVNLKKIDDAVEDIRKAMELFEKESSKHT